MAIVWFWKAIDSGDRLNSTLKDMAVVMKQQDRSEEAIEAIKSFRRLWSKQAQESLDNLLIDLYKVQFVVAHIAQVVKDSCILMWCRHIFQKCGKVEEQIELLKQKLKMIYLGEAFNGKATKKARSHGKKFQASIQQETSRILVCVNAPYVAPTHW